MRKAGVHDPATRENGAGVPVPRGHGHIRSRAYARDLDAQSSDEHSRRKRQGMTHATLASEPSSVTALRFGNTDGNRGHTVDGRPRGGCARCRTTAGGPYWYPSGRALGSRSPRPEQLPSLVPAMAAEASHSLADTANDLFLFVAQRRSTRRPDGQHPLGYGRAGATATTPRTSATGPMSGRR